jgi:hypothetical protein
MKIEIDESNGIKILINLLENSSVTLLYQIRSKEAFGWKIFQLLIF